MIQSVRIVIKAEEGSYLGVSRKDDHSNFGFVGGKIEEGERPTDTAVRELKEETGLDATFLRLIDYRIYDGVELFCFKGHAEGVLKTPAQLIESDESVAKWVTKEELLQGSFGAYNKIILEEVWKD